MVIAVVFLIYAGVALLVLGFMAGGLIGGLCAGTGFVLLCVACRRFVLERDGGDRR